MVINLIILIKLRKFLEKIKIGIRLNIKYKLCIYIGNDLFLFKKNIFIKKILVIDMFIGKFN